MKIVVDAMGGDKAPGVIIKGAIMAAREYDYHLILVGQEKAIKDVLRQEDYPEDRISICHASDAIGMEEPAAVSVRKKRDSSIVRGIDLLKKGEADAFVSAGNTGAVVCAATLSLRLLQGVDRPGIAVIFPTLGEPCMVLDV
ncbi:MAG TPA: phosphate--acyl-ACP acyltransferase, partial [Candidatus Omnitrophota bacterium]|nr:phosphate--acyl-ACP acyltransferase [Candidatus Omnitrophota bacterium]